MGCCGVRLGVAAIVVTVVTDDAGDNMEGVGQLVRDIWTTGTIRPDAFRTRVAGTI